MTWLNVAISEYHDAFTWYAAISPELGERFAGAVEAAVEQIAAHPEHHALVSHRYRRAIVEQFPYGIYFAYEGDRITVAACHHGKRNPRIWQRR